MRIRVKTALALVFVLPVVAGCEKSPRDKLQGRWLGESIENVPSAQLTKSTGWVKGTAIEFQGNKVTVTIPAETPRTGTFKAAKATEPDALLVSFVRGQLIRVGDQTLRWRIGDGREIVMLKAKN